MRTFLGFATFVSLASKQVNGHHRIPVIQVRAPNISMRFSGAG
jgi:hypothetical protein